MEHLVGVRGQVTLAKPIRVALPGTEYGSVRAVAFEGTLRGVTAGLASFDVDAWIIHPDDEEPQDPPRLDLYSAREDGNPVAAHIDASLVMSVVPSS